MSVWYVGPLVVWAPTPVWGVGDARSPRGGERAVGFVSFLRKSVVRSHLDIFVKLFCITPSAVPCALYSVPLRAIALCATDMWSYV